MLSTGNQITVGRRWIDRDVGSRWQWLRLLLLAVVAIPPSIAAESGLTVGMIRFEGNAVTRPSILLQELTFKPGDRFDPAAVDASRQALMNLGLFSDVRTEQVDRFGQRDITFIVTERYYILPLPRIDGDLDSESVSYGFDLRFDNLAGLNQRLKIDYNQRSYSDSDIETARLLSIDYRWPRLLGSRYDLSLQLATHQEQTSIRQEGRDLSGDYFYDSDRVAVGVSRWLNERGPRRGWRYHLGGALEQRTYRWLEGAQDLAADGELLQLQAGVGYFDLREKRFWREGYAYGYDVAISHPSLGSDFDWQRHLLWWRDYRPLANGATLNSRLQLGYASGHRYHIDNFTLGSSTSLRGYPSDYVTGDLLLLGNLEYLQQVGRYPQLRGVLFVDSGNVWHDAGALDASLLTAVGVGLRWRVQSFVDVQLRLDVAYGIGSGGNEVHAGTSVPF